MRSIYAAAVAAVLLTGVAGCGGGGEGAEAQESDAEAPRSVRVARVEMRPLGGGLQVTGALVALEEAAVGTEVAGYRVALVGEHAGDYVRAGQALAVLDDTLLRSDVAAQRAQVARSQASVAQQQAALQQAQVQSAQAQGEAARVSGLDNQGVLSQEAIEARRSAAASARAAVGSARAAVEAARADAAASRSQLNQVQTRLSRTTVTAPFAGRVLERNVRAGEVTGGAAQPMFRIARNGLVELDAEIAEAQLARVKAGDTAVVTLPSGGSVTGTVRYVDPTVDPQSRLGRARIALPGREDLRLGGSARATIQELSRPTLAVPEAAVRFTAEGPAVYVVGAQDRRVRRVPVRTGQRGAGYVELLQGPPPGAMVVLGGSAFVLEGDLVRPQLAAVAAGAARPAPAATKPPAALTARARSPERAGGQARQGAAQ